MSIKINPMLLIQLLRGGTSLEALIMNILQSQAGNNPIVQNAAALAKNGNAKGLEQVVRNVAKQKGIDFDSAFAQFSNSIR